MADRDDPTADLPPTPPVDEGADARTRATVTWRGIVDEPVAPEAPKKRSLFTPIGNLLSKLFVALGVKRGVNEDGSPATATSAGSPASSAAWPRCCWSSPWCTSPRPATSPCRSPPVAPSPSSARAST